MTVNCTGPEPTPGDRAPAEACGTCSSCRRVRSGLHPDVYWLRAESKLRILRVDQVRELIQAVQLKPTEARVKVGILDGADRLTPQAANAFLKTLEEPPARSLLILLSTEPDRLLETILSRCLRLTFPGQPAADESQLAWLHRLATALIQPSRSLLARYRILDDLLRRLTEIREASEKAVETRSPLAGSKDIDPAQREQWETEAKAAVEAEYRRRRGELLQLAEGWFRDVWLCTLDQPADRLLHPPLEPATRSLASRLNPAQALDNLRCLEETQATLHTTVQEALALEVALLRLRL